MWGHADDIVIYGKSEKEHDKHMLKMITRCNTTGLRLNHDKWRIKQRKIKFYIESLVVQMEFRETQTQRSLSPQADDHQKTPHTTKQALQTFHGLSTDMVHRFRELEIHVN